MEPARDVVWPHPHTVSVRRGTGGIPVPHVTIPDENGPPRANYRDLTRKLALWCRCTTAPMAAWHHSGSTIIGCEVRQHPHKLDVHGPERERYRHLPTRPIAMLPATGTTRLGPEHIDIVGDIEGFAEKMRDDIEYCWMLT